ncbi:clotting factor G beta subunit-like [Ornithodoros turicata]|uniref:clotting factor G beta subunit-like n=1 Tax=Ornithodoros turicata TaxID=34597 RepID=UPI0031391197
MNPFVLCLLATLCCGQDFSPSSPCTVRGGGTGECIPLSECPPLALQIKRTLRRPRPCGFRESVPLVCCSTKDIERHRPTTPPPLVVEEATTQNEPGCGLVVPDDITVEEDSSGNRRLSRSPWPWMAALFDKDTYFCGGTLLDRTTVLTAAHCFTDDTKRASDYKVRLGVLADNEEASDHSVTIAVKDLKVHEVYRKGRYYADIAILLLAERVPYNRFIAPICLPPAKLKLSGKVVVLGWGHTSFGGRYARWLQEGRVSVIGNRECDMALKASPSYVTFTEGVNDNFLCAVNNTGVDACQGDSGGPLLALGEDYRWQIVGVVSFGINCGAGFPGAYTRVTTFLPWIQRNRDH